jgi:hypothetical protein
MLCSSTVSHIIISNAVAATHIFGTFGVTRTAACIHHKVYCALWISAGTVPKEWKKMSTPNIYKLEQGGIRLLDNCMDKTQLEKSIRDAGLDAIIVRDASSVACR